MTKMPDKLHEALKKAKHTGHRIHLLMHPDDKWILDELVKAAEIPQPVTDEARAKALDAMENLEIAHGMGWDMDGVTDNVLLVSTTIKAALSQRAMDKVLSSNPHTHKESRDEFERGVKMAFEQPEAIQKAVEALKPYFVKGDKKVLLWEQDYRAYIQFNAKSHRAAFIKAIRTIIDCSPKNTHQSELESLKAENERLREAAAYLNHGLEHMIEAYGGETDDEGILKSYSEVEILKRIKRDHEKYADLIKHAATIKKTKESQNV